MKVLAKLFVCALALAVVTDATGPSDSLRAGCESADDSPTQTPTPLPSSMTPSPSVTSTAPTPSDTPKAPTPSETSAAPTPSETSAAPPTPSETSKAPTPSETSKAPTPSETSTVPTPSETSKAPTPSETTAAPVVVDKTKSYERDGIDCMGVLRVPRRDLGAPLDQTDCKMSFQIKYSSASETPTPGCVVCASTFVYDTSKPLAERDAPLCGGLPICTRLYKYQSMTTADVMCVLEQNGEAPVESSKACGLSD